MTLMLWSDFVGSKSELDRGSVIVAGRFGVDG